MVHLMCPVFVWSKGPEWLTPDAYPGVYAKFDIAELDPAAPLPETAGVLLVDRPTFRDRRADIEAFVGSDGAVIAVGETADEAMPLKRKRRRRRAYRAARARLPIAGTSIVKSSLYGKWKVVPILGNDQEPCGRARTFHLKP